MLNLPDERKLVSWNVNSLKWISGKLSLKVFFIKPSNMILQTKNRLNAENLLSLVYLLWFVEGSFEIFQSANRRNIVQWKPSGVTFVNHVIAFPHIASIRIFSIQSNQVSKNFKKKRIHFGLPWSKIDRKWVWSKPFSLSDHITFPLSEVCDTFSQKGMQFLRCERKAKVKYFKLKFDSISIKFWNTFYFCD